MTAFIVGVIVGVLLAGAVAESVRAWRRAREERQDRELRAFLATLACEGDRAALAAIPTWVGGRPV